MRGLFSECETYFANTMFHPYLKKEKTVFDYNDKLFYFLTSLSWRSLYWDLIDFVENHIVGIDALECLISSEKTMKEFLLHKRSELDGIENHIFFFDEIMEISGNADGDISQLRPHTTFHRGISSYTFCYEKEGTYGTITNMMGIIIITFYHLGKDEKWENTRIENGFSRIEAKNQIITSVVGNEFRHIMQTARKAASLMSEPQKKKVQERIKKAGETIKDSPVFNDLLNDIRISKKD